jgi:hypothetical protein
MTPGLFAKPLECSVKMEGPLFPARELQWIRFVAGRHGHAAARSMSRSPGNAAWTMTLSPDPFHALADAVGNAANFRFKIPASNSTRFVTISFEGEALLSIRPSWNVQAAAACASGRLAAKRRGLPWPGTAAPLAPATIIEPVYRDFDATKACIDSVLNQAPGATQCRVIAIDDATPDMRIRGDLENLANADRIKRLTNERNMGFVESVNRGLTEAADGDVVLLNVDTIVPSGFADRLAAAARTSPDIGTVTPISNNGEFTSFPVPNTQNRMPSYEEIEAIDRMAAEVNAGRIVDIPNGIGFCLYVTRKCLNALAFFRMITSAVILKM